jgi:hypothetical protein
MSNESGNDLGSFEEFEGDSPDASNDSEETDDVAQNATDDVRRGQTQVVEEPDDAPSAEAESIPRSVQGEDRSSEELAEEVFDLQERVESVEAETDRLEPVDAENPTGVDPVPGKWDLCFDRAKPGARVYVVDVLAESVPDYRENYPDAPELDSYEGNVLSRMREADRVLAAIYVKDTLTSVSYTAYPMPESRLTRLPAEEASLVGNSTAEFDRPPVDDHRLDGAEPAGVPEDADRDENGEAVLQEDA